MLTISLISLLIAVPLFSYRITPDLFNRITSLSLAFAGYLSGFFHVTNLSQGIEVFLLVVGSIILISWANFSINTSRYGSETPTISEYSLLIIFTTIGGSLLISSSDIVSMFLSIELQSFAVYVLATLYRNSESATAAGLKYFLLGGLSSSLILLGTALIYSNTGLTHFDSIYNLLSVEDIDSGVFRGVQLGIVLIGVGFLFKVAAAPFHNWAPDVYDGTVLGLSQYKIKRLLTYSTISHVGFLLLALSMNTQESVESFIFYLVQYTITNVNVFIVLLALGYIISNTPYDIEFIEQLKSQFGQNPFLSVSFAVCLFSIAGIPPLIGFFAKQIVLYSSMNENNASFIGYYFLSITAILVSVISAFYYLKIVQAMYFEKSTSFSEIRSSDGERSTIELSESTLYKATSVSNLHSVAIATLTIVIVLFIFQPIILLNSCHLLALSLFYY
ncbi:NADH dehydrogenase subunits 2, 5 [Handroanthus impetiginosus]|uniref:NADH dehydrogenase subunits 2, 5 n=1 Tax=Handroanthus impetiginosus TaxID=429701 RepID=A0A2G9G1U3_9LAMI|nr:NADH dehydrogenase subunits 2, 5 [Handroanthus impetiginosus]